MIIILYYHIHCYTGCLVLLLLLLLLLLMLIRWRQKKHPVPIRIRTMIAHLQHRMTNTHMTDNDLYAANVDNVFNKNNRNAEYNKVLYITDFQVSPIYCLLIFLCAVNVLKRLIQY